MAHCLGDEGHRPKRKGSQAIEVFNSSQSPGPSAAQDLEDYVGEAEGNGTTHTLNLPGTLVTRSSPTNEILGEAEHCE